MILTKFGQWDDIIISQLPFFSSYRHIPPREIFVKLANWICDRRKWRRVAGKVYFVKIGTKLGQNLSEMEVRTFVRMNKVIWDQLLATKVEIIKGKLYFLLQLHGFQ